MCLQNLSIVLLSRYSKMWYLAYFLGAAAIAIILYTTVRKQQVTWMHVIAVLLGMAGAVGFGIAGGWEDNGTIGDPGEVEMHRPLQVSFETVVLRDTAGHFVYVLPQGVIPDSLKCQGMRVVVEYAEQFGKKTNLLVVHSADQTRPKCTGAP